MEIIAIACDQTEFKKWISGRPLSQTLLVELTKLKDPELNKHLHTIGSIFDMYDPKNDYMQADSNLNQILARHIINYYKSYFHEHMEVATQQGIPPEHYTSYLAYAIEQVAIGLEHHTGIDTGHWMITILYALDEKKPYTVSALDEQYKNKDYLKININTYTQLTNMLITRFIITAKPEYQEQYQKIKTGLYEKYACEELIHDIDKPELNLDTTKNMLTPTIPRMFEPNDGSSIRAQLKIKKFQDFLIQCLDSDSSIYVLDQPYIKRILKTPGYSATKLIPIKIKNMLTQLDSEDLSFEQRKKRCNSVNITNTPTEITISEHTMDIS